MIDLFTSDFHSQIYENSKGTQENKTFVKVPFPLDLGLFWWNGPPLLSLKPFVHAELPAVKEDPPSLGKLITFSLFVVAFCN